MAPPDAMRSREQRVVRVGIITVVVALLVAYVGAPFARRWQVREAAIDAAADRVAYLESLVARTAALEAAATRDERQLSSSARRVTHARSRALAASATQSLLQDAADASRVVVTRLDVSTDTAMTGATDGASALPVTLSAYGDIVGVSTLLELLASGPRVLLVDRVVLQRNSALAGAADVVQTTLTLRAPVIVP